MEHGSGEVRLARGRAEIALAGRLRDAEPVRLTHELVESFESGQHPRHHVADAVVVAREPFPVGRTVGHARPRHPRDDVGLRQQVLGGGLLLPHRQVHHAHRVLHRLPLEPAGLLVAFGAPEAREDERLLPVHDVTAVQFRAHLNRQPASAQRLGGVRRVGRGQHEVAAETHENLDGALVHLVDAGDGVQPRLTRRGDPKNLVELVQQPGRRMVVDAAGAVALHVAVPAHGCRPRTRPADVASEQQHVRELPHHVDRVLLLTHPEAPADDRPAGLQVERPRRADLLLGEAGLLHQLRPRRRLHNRAVLLNAVGVLRDELGVERSGIDFGRLEHDLRDSAHQRHVAAGAHLQVESAGLVRLEQRHVDEVVRHDRAPGRSLDQRIDMHHLRAVLHSIRQRRQHARRIRGSVHTEQEQHIGLLPVLDRRRPLARPDRRCERPAGCLVAHVRAVRHVVRAVLANHQLIEEGCLVAEPPRGVERRLIRTVQPPQLFTDQREGVTPADRRVTVGLRVVDHRLGQTAGVLELEVGPGGELAHGVLREEAAPDALVRHFPRDVLHAVLADVELQTLLVVWPRASGAVEALDRVVHREHRQRPAHRTLRFQ